MIKNNDKIIRTCFHVCANCAYICTHTNTQDHIHNTNFYIHTCIHICTLVCPPLPLAARSDRYNNDNLSEEEEVVESNEETGNPFIKFDSQSRRMSILLSDWSLNSSFDSQDETKRKFSEASSTTVTSEEGRLVEVVTLVRSHTTHTRATLRNIPIYVHT